jgi:cytochrome c-type biogenesis protein CcmH/NrfF
MPRLPAELTRREALALSLGALLPAVLSAQDEQAQDESDANRLYRPDLAGRPRARITDYENDPFIIGVEEKIRCTCGCNLDVYTCRTTDFTCGTSPAMHREVVGLVEQGMTAQEILDAFVAQHGEAVLMAPKKEGFNLAGYFVPGAAIALVGAVLIWVLTRRSGQLVEAAAEREAGAAGMSADESARLEAEMRNLE